MLPQWIYPGVAREGEIEKEMGFAAASIIAASILLVCTNHIVLASDEANGGVVHIGGKVLCQDCTQGWNEWVHGSKPIKGIIRTTCTSSIIFIYVKIIKL